jgi:RNA polymerase primary sigma factor
MQYEIYDKGGLMKKKRQNLELWMGELRDKVRKDGTISNKDIILFFTEKNLGQDDLSAVYELLHESNIDINFDEDASDEDLEILEDEETDDETDEELDVKCIAKVFSSGKNNTKYTTEEIKNPFKKK